MRPIAACARKTFHHLTGVPRMSNEKGLLAKIGEVVEATKGKAPTRKVAGRPAK
jgi:hypothetical protein